LGGQTRYVRSLAIKW